MEGSGHARRGRRSSGHRRQTRRTGCRSRKPCVSPEAEHRQSHSTLAREQSQADPSEGGAARSLVDARSEMATRQQNTHDLAVTRPLRPCTRCPSYELSQPGPWMSCGESVGFGGSWKAAWARGSEGAAAASGWAEAARARATAGRSTTGGSMGWLKVQRLNPIRDRGAVVDAWRGRARWNWRRDRPVGEASAQPTNVQSHLHRIQHFLLRMPNQSKDNPNDPEIVT